MQYYADVTAAIKAQVPKAVFCLNKVPKPWFEKEIYVQLVANDEYENPFYDAIPRLWAFEVSTVVDGVDILFYSKMMSRMWPDPGMLSKRIKAFDDDRINEMSGAELKAKYQTTGQCKAAPRQRNARLGSTGASFNPGSTGRSFASGVSPLRAPAKEPIQEEEKK